MSAFTDALRRAANGRAGMTTGEPRAARRVGWDEVHADALAAAAILAERGVGPRDAVAVLAGGPADVARAAQGVWLAGGSVTMLHQPTARTDLAAFAADTATALRVIGAKALVVGDPFTEVAGMLAGTGVVGITSADLAAGAAWDAPDVDPAEDWPVLLQLTSGSTATPKAVEITHGNLWASAEAMYAGAGLGPDQDDVFVSWLPLFHDMGMVGFLTMPMCFGIESVAVTPRDFLSAPLLWMELISKYRGTHTAAPNFAYALTARALQHAQGLDLARLRFALNGAEPIDVGAVRAFLAAGARFGLSENAVIPAYGMAEATLGISFHPIGAPLEVDTVDAVELEEHGRAEAVDAAVAAGEHVPVRSFPRLGRPLAGIEVRAVGPAGEHLGEREVGVLHLRGEAICRRYLTVDGPLDALGADGWLDTGDLGYLVDGRVVVCGRVKDVIIMGGRNIYPTDIERIAEQVPGVRAGNAAAVRWTAPGGRESFAVLVESRETDAAERLSADVRAAITATIGVRPAVVTVLAPGTLPKTPSGKIKRTAAAALVR